MRSATEGVGGPTGSPPRVSRRTLLATGAAALAVGAAGTEVGNLATGSAPLPRPSVPPDVDLMEEHGVLKRVLLIYREALRRIDGGQEPPVAAIQDGALIVHDFIEGFHEPLEEGYVFPRLRRARELVGTVDTLLLQHARGRERTQRILAGATTRGMGAAGTRAQVTAAMVDFVQMYEPHEAREDTVVFPAFRALLSAAELDDLGAAFADLQRSQFGRNAFAEVVDHVASIERSLGIYDLARFTPPPVTP